MSNNADSNLDLDLHFLPAWAQQSASVNQYANFEGGAEDRPGRRRFDRPPGRRGGPEGGPRQGGPGRPRPERPGRSGYDPTRRGPYRDRDQDRPRPELPPPDLEVLIQPEGKGADALARQIKQTGRAYPLFDIAFLVLKKPERYLVVYQVKRNSEGQIIQPLYHCNIDETLWLSEQEAVDHVLNRHFGTFYQTEKIPTEPPKGRYTFVAQCALSGIILGPPNYHDYQTKLLRLHAERFSHMPFEVYKSRIRIVRDEAVVKQWLDDQSFRTEFLCLNVPEAIKLSTREEVERHFREVHLSNVIQPVESYTYNALVARSLPCRRLQSLARRVSEEQRRFPIKVVNALSHQFASSGLHFFKVNKTVIHVSAARPHFLDLSTTVVSEGVKAIIEYINAHSRTTRRELVEALAPSAARPAASEVKPEAEPAVQASAIAEAPVTAEAPAPAAAPAPAPTPEVPPAPTVSPAVSAILSDLHWLMHEGHVIEFANGILETAKRPAPRPPRPQPLTQPQPHPQPQPESPSPLDAGAEAPAGEVTTTSDTGPLETEPVAPEAASAETTEPMVADVPTAPAPEAAAPEIPPASDPAEAKPTSM